MRVIWPLCEGFKRELKELKDEKPDLTSVTTLCTNVLTTLARSPGRVYEGKEPDHSPVGLVPYQHLLENCSCLRQRRASRIRRRFAPGDKRAEVHGGRIILFIVSYLDAQTILISNSILQAPMKLLLWQDHRSVEISLYASSRTHQASQTACSTCSQPGMGVSL